MKYFKPKSLTWWAAIAEAVINVVRAVGVEIPKEVDGVIVPLIAIGLRASKSK